MALEERLPSGEEVFSVSERNLPPEVKQAVDDCIEQLTGRRTFKENTLQSADVTLKSIDATLKSINRTLIQLQNQFSVLDVSRLLARASAENSTG